MAPYQHAADLFKAVAGQFQMKIGIDPWHLLDWYLKMWSPKNHWQIVVSSTMNPKIARISALVIRTERKYNEIHSNAFEFEVLFSLLNEYDVKDSSRRVKISRMNRIELKVNILIFIYTALYRLIPRNPKNQYLNSWSFKRHVCWAHVSAVNVLLSLRLRWFQYEHLPFLIPSFIHTVTSNVKY